MTAVTLFVESYDNAGGKSGRGLEGFVTYDGDTSHSGPCVTASILACMDNHNQHTGYSSNELYDPLSPEVRSKLAACEQTSTVPAEKRLMSHGEYPQHLIIVNSGSVEISLPTEKRTVPVSVAGEGKVFGLRTLVSGTLPEIDVTALEECRLTLIPAGNFLEVLKQHPQMYLAIAQVLSADLKMVEGFLKQRTFTTTRRAPALAVG